MPGSHKMEVKAQQKANKAAGIGDADGRIVREKASAIMISCTVCQMPMKCTKTNTELKAHAEGKHSKGCEECFPGADAAAAELIGRSGAKGDTAQASGPTKAQTKKKNEANLDDLLSAGLSSGKGKAKK